MIVRKSSVFPASRETVFEKLQQLETLRYIAKPYATFEPIGEAVSTWTVGSTILRFDPDGVSSHEGNERVPVWNHDIMMESIDANHTRYTDRVEIQAGWKTVFVWLWASAFYRHRQRKWIRLLKQKE